MNILKFLFIIFGISQISYIVGQTPPQQKKQSEQEGRGRGTVEVRKVVAEDSAESEKRVYTELNLSLSLLKKVILGTNDFKKSQVATIKQIINGKPSVVPAVRFDLTVEGKKKIKKWFQRQDPDLSFSLRLAFLVNGEIFSAPFVDEGTMASGTFFIEVKDKATGEAIVNMINGNE